MDTDVRLYNLERDNAEIRDRLGKVEDKASNAWKSINEVKEDVGNLYDKVEELDRNVKEVISRQTNMEVDMKTIKAEQTETGETLKKMKKWLAGITLVVIVAGIVMYKKGSDIPAQVVELVIPYLNQI